MTKNDEHLMNQSLETLSLEGSESFYSIEQNQLIGKFNKGAIIEESLAKALNEELRRKIIKLSCSQKAQFQTPGVCRICLQSDLDDSNKCLTPCSCRGSMSKVHRICLQTWLTEVQSNECEICKFKYKTKKIAKYSLIGSIKAWLCSSERREEIKELVHDGFVLLIVAPTLICLSYVGFCVTDNLLTSQIPDTDPLLSRVLAFTACTTIMCTDFMATLWSFCRAQHHLACWTNFYNRSQEVIIVIDPKFSENEIN
ncbi:Zinc finger, RING-CH-type,Zinc finger, RING/FYVE/PHD-type [Cinara cedri]|uniref:Zinc finger, RING-CH-type,Zinc finger, RING/FYVE/PHD-type n=1 Tax=Cinara cedri TaxID=506608 RepID=A0A5E4M5Z8_9HEMI|nr:Zinc finger, RING-CH-type,Zinc finger, RING/FYVE/PHD-type [Cinara cedri]